MKRLLVFSAYYEPEVAASLYLSTNLYEDFANNGWMVELFVPLPTRGIDESVRRYYANKKYEEKCNGNLKIHRIWLPRERKNAVQRCIRYLLMNFAFIIKGLSIKADAIFVQSTPPTQGAMATIIKKLKRIPFLYNLQDIFPDSMVSMGMTKENSVIFKIGRMIENFTYNNADKIVVISNDMKNNIVNKGVSIKKISVVHNWIDANIVKPIESQNNYLYDKYQIDRNKFNVVYAGNLGYAQNIKMILDCAQMIQDEKNIRFLIFGTGSQEEEIKKYAEELKLENTKIFPILPYSEVSYVYSLGNASIVSCKYGFGGSAMPSKTWSIMATGTPVLASFDAGTDMEKLIVENELGLFSVADDANALSDNIIKLYNSVEMQKRMSNNCRQYVEQKATRKICTKQYMDVLRKLENKRRKK